MNKAIPSYFSNPEHAVRLQLELHSWKGTPFAHYGRLPGVGVDCVHLAGEVMVACGVVEAYDFGRYPLDWSTHQERSLIVEYLVKTGRFAFITSGEPLLGDVLCFKIGHCAQHCGIAVGPLVFWHVLNQGRCGTARLNDPTWSRRLSAIYRPLPAGLSLP